MAQRRCAHFDELVCLKAPSVFGQKMQVYREEVSKTGKGLGGRGVTLNHIPGYHALLAGISYITTVLPEER